MSSPEPIDRPREVGDLVARLSADGTGGGRVEAGRSLARVARALGSSARAAGGRAVGSGRWLADLLLDIVPRIPVRDLATLRAHHPGLAGDALADALVAAATKATTAVGAGAGALAAAEFVATPTLLGAPVQIAAETLVVAAIEVKLIAELHEVYGRPVLGTGTTRAAAYVGAWAQRRGVNPLAGAAGFSLGAAAKAQLRRRLLAKAGRNLTSLGPALTGAVANGAVNRHETRKLADAVRADLRKGTSASVPFGLGHH